MALLTAMVLASVAVGCGAAVTAVLSRVEQAPPTR
jgi:hypothetical protein